MPNNIRYSVIIRKSLSYKLSNRAGVCLLDISSAVPSLLGELLGIKNNCQANYFTPELMPSHSGTCVTQLQLAQQGSQAGPAWL